MISLKCLIWDPFIHFNIEQYCRSIVDLPFLLAYNFNIKVPLGCKMIDYELLSDLINKSNTLLQEHKDFFLLYHECVNAPAEITATWSDAQRDELSRLIVKKLDDKSFNDIICAFEKEMKEIKGHDGGTIMFPHLDILKALSFEMQKYRDLDRQFDSISKRMEIGLAITAHGESLEASEKLSLAELGMIAKFQKLQYCINVLRKKNLILASDKKYRTLEKQCEKMDRLDRNIKARYDVEEYQSGSIVATHTEKFESYKLKNSTIDRRQTIKSTGLFGQYGHAAQLVPVAGKKVKQSHLWDLKHRIHDLTFETALTSDIFRLNIAKLVKPSHLQHLQQTLGDNWEQHIQQLYAQKIAKVSSDPLLDKIILVHDAASRLKAMAPLLIENKNFFGLFVESNHGAKALYKDVQSCSMYTAREICEAIKLVNRELNKTNTAVNLNDAIRLPFADDVDINEMRPPMLMELLTKAGCLEEADPTKLGDLIDTKNNFNLLIDQQVELTAALYEKIVSIYKKHPLKDGFVKEAKVALMAYLTANEIFSLAPDDKAKAQEINKFLDENITKMYKKTHRLTHQNRFVRSFFEFFQKLAEFLGIRTLSVKAIIDRTVNHLQENYAPKQQIYP